jgi:branched-chain amino acid transport system ATP-binding protein
MDLHVHYGAAEAVRGIGFDAPAGSVTVLLGRNGAGKSTILQAIGGFVRRSSGAVELDGVPLPNGAARRCVEQGVAYVPETRRLFPTLSVEDNLRVGRRSRRGNGRPAYSPEGFRERFEMIDRLWKRSAGTLSGGEQQFVTVCRGFCLDPRVVLLDEVSQGVAPKAAMPLIELVAEFVEGGGVAVVAEQNLKLATELVSRAGGHVHVLESGAISVGGDWREILQSDVLERAIGIRGG